MPPSAALTTMQQMIRDGRMGEHHVLNPRESVYREVRRGHMSRWVGAVHAPRPVSEPASLT